MAGEESFVLSHLSVPVSVDEGLTSTSSELTGSVDEREATVSSKQFGPVSSELSSPVSSSLSGSVSADICSSDLSGPVSIDALPEESNTAAGVQDVSLQMVELRVDDDKIPKTEENQKVPCLLALEEKLIGCAPSQEEAKRFDGIILYHEDDHKPARDFLARISSVTVESGEPLNVVLFEETISVSKPFFEALEEVIDKTLYTFIFVTNNFTEEKLWTLVKDSCLIKMLYDPKRLWSVVPVWTEKRSRFRKVPFGLNAITGLNYYKNNEHFSASVQQLYVNSKRTPVSLPGKNVAQEDLSFETMFQNVDTNVELEDKMIPHLAVAIGKNWQFLAHEVGLSIIDIEHIEADRDSVKMRVYEVLTRWKGNPQTIHLTVEDLIKAIRKNPAISVDWKTIRKVVAEYSKT